MKKQIIYFNLILLILMQLDVLAQNNMQKDNAALKRYKNDVFTNFDSLIDIPSGKAINLKGENEKLLLNLFMPPAVDTVTNRPLVNFIHGGGFRNNNKSSSNSNKLGIRLGKKGFVVASIVYRLGITTAWRPFYNAGHTLNNIPGQGTAADSKLRQDTLLFSMEHWLFTQFKRNVVNNNFTMNGPWKNEADIEQNCNSQSNSITIRLKDLFLEEDGMPRKNLNQDDKLYYNEQEYKVWGTAINDQVKLKINY